MNEISMKAYAKINLCLDVLGKLENNYHQVEMVMQQVNLYDTVTVKYYPLMDEKAEQRENEQIEVTTNCEGLLTDQANLAYKAAALMQSIYNPNCRIAIELEKRIPIAAGLAGGSADAAAVMLALSQLWHLNLKLQDLLQLGVKLGADVPFCIMGQVYKRKDLQLREKELASTCAFAEGIGEKLTPLPPLDGWILLSKPPVNISTKSVYDAFLMDKVKCHPNTTELISGLKERNLNKIQKNMINVLETVTLNKNPSVLETKLYLKSFQTAYQVLMSGSGPTIFSLYTSKNKARTAYINSKKKNEDTYLIRTLS